MIRVTVVRGNWYRGREEAKLQLLDGRRCCLGFAALACGAVVDDIVEEPDPSCIRNPTEEIRAHMLDQYGACTHVIERMIMSNDSGSIDDKEREREIARLGLEAGLVFKFVD